MTKSDAALKTLHSEIRRMRELQREYRKTEQGGTDPAEVAYASGAADVYAQLINAAYELADDWAGIATQQHFKK